ncbi:Transmembrane protein 147 [Mytilus coruscus]|uniref:BOS complex subunit TMEM147 n=1 Tax=Mytilus coruscus TaxID=42192 RepID=A0A6J8E4R8_MYTCO|nr:Transmembrane protein 147 [Mytilus coruscus]
MTLFHFGNCLALAYVPYMIVYKFSGLAEYGAFWKCVQAGGAYMFTQLCKMLVLATFFPATEVSTGLDVVGEFMKSTVDFADLVGIYFVMSKIAGKGQLKFMVAGLGWATAELLVTRTLSYKIIRVAGLGWVTVELSQDNKIGRFRLVNSRTPHYKIIRKAGIVGWATPELLVTRLLPLWVGARGVEFDWKYIQMCFESNINLGHHMCAAMLVWLYSRNDLQKTYVPIVMSLLALSCYRPLIVEILIHAVGLGSWTLLAAKALFTTTVGVIGLQIFLTMAVQTSNNHY